MGLEFDSIRKHYGPVTALAGISLTVEPDTIHCIAGPNGAGKTTLLRVALGLTQPTAGTVTVDGSCGAAFQTASIFSDLTVAENLSTFAGMAGHVDDAWANHVVEELGLGPVQGRVARALSVGYRNRLDLAAGLITGHNYLVCDEPLGDVDAPTRGRLVDLLAAVEGGVLLSTHELEPFAAICDQLTILDRGRVLADVRVETVEGDLQDHYEATLAGRSTDRDRSGDG